ncbi:CDGSH iron-sulfur domain-containing protein [Jatrophihabitans sp. YIM 134969]
MAELAERGGTDGSITVYPDGPLLVRGDVRIENPDGTAIRHVRRTVALCRCGKSALKPWCDGTHKIARFTAP